MVLAAYRAEHPDKLKPTPDVLATYEDNLENTYDDEIRNQANANGVDPNKFNRSMLVFFANQATVSTTKKQVEHAYKYFLAVTPVP
jgi:hypothetical protein